MIFYIFIGLKICLKGFKKAKFSQNAENFYAWDPMCISSCGFSVTEENTYLMLCIAVRGKRLKVVVNFSIYCGCKLCKSCIQFFKLLSLISKRRLSARYFLCLRQCYVAVFLLLDIYLNILYGSVLNSQVNVLKTC